MSKLPNLSDTRKRRSKALEPSTRNAAKTGNYNLAKTIAYEIQEVLRRTGHETRLMQSKNRLFEAAMEAGNLQIAITGLTGVKKKCSPGPNQTHL